MKPCLHFEVLFKALCYNTLVKFFFVFFVLGNEDFLSSKMPRNSWGKVSLKRVLYREQIMHHGWSVILT